jgi:hypothetical protein
VMPAVIHLNERFAELWKQADKGEGFADTLGNFLKDMFSPERISNALAGIQNVMQSVIEGVAEWLEGGGLTRMIEPFLNGKSEFLDAALELFTTLLTGLAEILPQIVEFIVGDLIPKIVDTIVKLVPLVVNALVASLPALIRGAITLFLGIVQGVTKALPSIIDAIVDVIPVLVDTITAALPDIITASIDLFLGVAMGLMDALPTIIDAVIGAIPKIVTALINSIPQIIQASIILFLALGQGLMEALPSILGMIVTDLIPSLVTAIGEGAGALWDAGWNLLNALWDGMKAIAESIFKWVVDVGKRVWGWLNPFDGPATGMTQEQMNAQGKAASTSYAQQVAARQQLLAGMARSGSSSGATVVTVPVNINITGVSSTADATAAGKAAADAAMRRLSQARSAL